jgi:hypothetical protein
MLHTVHWYMIHWTNDKEDRTPDLIRVVVFVVVVVVAANRKDNDPWNDSCYYMYHDDRMLTDHLHSFLRNLELGLIWAMIRNVVVVGSARRMVWVKMSLFVIVSMSINQAGIVGCVVETIMMVAAQHHPNSVE